ncbi:ABC transporter permease [Nocardioides sp. LML1-1-1.1]|uniref:ABC transporter permease n=1 Tax=Nocardioides sp. LML1-1-1.1 TaxID=3135248 RepID=UPI00341A7EC0
MSATTTEPSPAAVVPAAGRTRPAPAPTPFRRVMHVELRKMFDTRSGFWLMASIVIVSAIATTLTALLGDRDSLTFESFAAAIGSPMSIILPVIGVLAVTSEWSQRTALTTFTLVSSRPRVLAAKLIDILVVGVVAMFVALGVGALGTIVTSMITGYDVQWDISPAAFAQIILANSLGMVLGFAFGLLFRSSPAAIVAYFVVNLVLPGLSGALGAAQEWWADHAAWFDLNETRFQLFDGAVHGQDWLQLAITALLWIGLPLLVGLRLVLRSEVK